jgi:hypothetical protein
MHYDRKTEGTFLQDFLHLETERLKSCPKSFHKVYIVLLCSSDQRLQLCGITSHRFLAQDMLLGLYGVQCVGVMVSVRCTNVYSIDILRLRSAKDLILESAIKAKETNRIIVHFLV